MRLQKKFRAALNRMQSDRSDLSVFNANLCEQLLYTQYKVDKESTFSKWLDKVNMLDYNKRTRAFFFELRRKHKNTDLVGPINDSLGMLSWNLDGTLKNSDFYSKLYMGRDLIDLCCDRYTPSDDPIFDASLNYSEFLDAIYSLKSHKAPGYDHITNEDITYLIPFEGSEEQDFSKKKNKLSAVHL